VRISERLLTVLACCLLAVAIPAGAGGKSERELLQAQELLDKAQEAIRPANDLLGRQPLEQADYDAAVKIAAQVMDQYLGPAMTLIDQAKARKPKLPEVPSTIMKLARTLVDAKQYATAIGWLVQAMEDYPDWREPVDELVARIMKVQERYNATYREFLDAVENEDAEQALEILGELKRINPYPDPAIKRSLAAAERRLRGQAEFNRFDAVMDAAAAQLAEGKQQEALATYLDGFSIGRAEFDGADYPGPLRDQALAAVARLQDAARAAPASQAGLPRLPTLLEELLRRPVTESARQQFLSTLSALERARTPEEQARAAAVAVRDVNAAIDAANADAAPSDLWLGFVEWYALGRPDQPPEGIAFAIRQPWMTIARSLSDTATAAADAAGAAMDAACTAERGAPIGEFRTLAQEARNRGGLAIGVLEAETPIETAEESYRPSAEDTARAAELSARLARFRQLVADADAREAFAVAEAAAGDTLAALELRLTTAPSTSAADAATLTRGRNEMAVIRESAASGAGAWAERAASAPAGSVMNARASAVEGRFNDLRSRAVAADAAFAVRIAALEAASFEPRLTEAAARQARGQALAAGTAGSQAPAGKRPDLGVEEFIRAQADVGILISAIDEWTGRWNAEAARVAASDGIALLLAAQEGLRTRAAALQDGLAADATAAQAAVDRAGQLRGQGDSAFQAGQAEEKQQKYAEALASYTTARDSYRDSLDWQENAAARNRLAELPAILERVAVRARQQNLAEAQALFNRGLDTYGGLAYQDAITTLENAQDLWISVTGDRNPTIDIYIDRAKAALLVTGKQDITRTDPIYEDIRGFMTQAELSYARADALQKSGSRGAEYRGAITSARASVNAITAVVPEYRDARLMSLKIDQLELGADEFARELLRRIASALADAKSSTALLVRNAYYNLVAYTKLDRWKDIVPKARRDEVDRAIDTLEVQLGLKEAPLSGIVIAQSVSKYRSANTEYRKNVNDRIQWEGALRLLLESLSLNPKNQDSQRLQNEIVLKRGTSVDVLSTEDLARYRAALTDFLNGNIARARTVVVDLLDRYPRNPLLRDLLQQIQARG